MVNMKVCVQKQRKDGFWPVYIRVTNNKKVAYINTGKLAAATMVDDGQVNDPYLMQVLGAKIEHYIEILNHVDYECWSIKEIVDHICTADKDICFSDYARQYIKRLYNDDKERTSRNYKWALNSLEMYVGTNQLMFANLTSSLLNGWIDSLKNYKRCKESYPICIRQVWRDAMKKLNDEEKGIILVKNYPWNKIIIPKSDETEHKAQSPVLLRQFFSAPLPDSRMKIPLAQLAQDVCKMCFCLGGMNTVDLYRLKKEDYYDGIIHYKRSKTRGKRTDEAYMEMRVPDIIKPLFEQYKATKKDNDRLLCFSERMTTNDSFSANVNIGIKQICMQMGIDRKDGWDFYTFRHSWGTIAKNDIGAHTEDVAFTMNHSSAHHVTEIYVKKDFSRAWELNEKVLEFIFFSDDPGSEAKAKEKLLDTDRISKYNEMKGSAFFMGKCIVSICGSGYTNKKEIVEQMIEQLPPTIPEGAKVQFVVENMDKNERWMYEHQKGKGF